ncbi:MAG: UDP-N-acetylmuramoyl-tripeptide--D-alanyl-D-alanine ligase [Bdellovibrionales bacterium]|nr:UDP-N-acetylmuramoyl-tripeptide--D-alanyl-D-alanine ligase [Bdellovibrionales bacterium]
MKVSDFIKATGAKVLSSGQESFVGVTTDSRDPQIKDKMFIALLGDVHDAHKFVESAVRGGAPVVVVHSWQTEWEPLKEKATFLLVEDTLKALQSFAKFHRQKFAGIVIGITGSNGKTTTKDFTFQILNQEAPALASQGSFNNHWGVPLTLLDIRAHHKFCIVEMGMNHPGELENLSQLVQANVVTVTNVGRAHIGFFKEVKNIAKAKEEIYIHAPKDCLFAFNMDNEWTRQMMMSHKDHAFKTYSNQDESTDIYLKVSKTLAKGFEIEGHIGGEKGNARVLVWGEHNVANLAAAAAMSYIAGMPAAKIWRALAKVHTGWGRNQWVSMESGGDILFDGYNANPDSFATLLKNIELPLADYKKRIAVFGEMLELGQLSEEEHFDLGRIASQLPWDQAYFIGPSGEAFRRGWQSENDGKTPVVLNTYKDFLELNPLNMVDQHSIVVIKGSRGGALERVVEAFKPVNFSRK